MQVFQRPWRVWKTDSLSQSAGKLWPNLLAPFCAKILAPAVKTSLWLGNAGLQPSSWPANLVELLVWASSNYACILLFLNFIRYQQTSISKTVLQNMGVGRGRGACPFPGFWNLTFSYYILTEKVVFLVSRGINEMSPLLDPPGKIILATSGKIHYCPSWKTSFRRPCYKTLPRKMSAFLLLGSDCNVSS